MGTRAKSKLMAKIDSIIEYAQSSNMQYTAKKKMRIISDLDVWCFSIIPSLHSFETRKKKICTTQKNSVLKKFWNAAIRNWNEWKYSSSILCNLQPLLHHIIAECITFRSNALVSARACVWFDTYRFLFVSDICGWRSHKIEANGVSMKIAILCNEYEFI